MGQLSLESSMGMPKGVGWECFYNAGLNYRIPRTRNLLSAYPDTRIRSGVRPPLPPIFLSVWLSGYADTQWTSTLNSSCLNALFILYHFFRSNDFMGESLNPNWYTYPSLLSQALQFILSLLIPQVGFDASSFSPGTYLVVHRRSGDRTSLSRCNCFSSIPCFSLSKTMQCHSLVRQSFFSEPPGACVSARFTSLQL